MFMHSTVPDSSKSFWISLCDSYPHFPNNISGMQTESLEGYLIVVNSWLNDEDIHQQIVSDSGNKDIYLTRYFVIINSLISCHSSFVLGIVIFPLSWSSS